MKKLILLAVLFVGVGVQQVSAQKWLKTLGKVANAALTDDQKKTDATAKTQSKGTPSQNVQASKNTNADNIVSSMPELTFKLVKCARQGNDVVISAILKNTSSKELTIQPKGEVTIFDSEGDAYELNGEACTFGNDHWDSYNYAKLPAGIPIKVKFVIPNVSPSAAELSIVKLGYETRPDYKKNYFEIRNLAIMAQ